MCSNCVVYFSVAAPVSSVLTTEGDVFLCSSDCKEKEVAEQAKDDAAAKRLWAISEKWTGLTWLPFSRLPIFLNTPIPTFPYAK